ncbi:MAG: hypothetical protein ACKOWN_00325 [Microbacteriaceae bacterium]
MAGRSLTSSVSLGTAPRWAALLGIIVVSRTVSTALMLWFAAGQAENAWTGARPDLFEFSRIWDSHWYRIVAEVGYPSELPIGDDGRVGENAWAFMPMYPMIVRAFMVITGAPFAYVSVFLSLAAFAAFIVLADRLFRHLVGDRAALWAVAVVAFAPVSPVYQVGYAESLGMVFLTLVLIGAIERRWALAAVAIPLTALTRPLGTPLALLFAILVLVKWKSEDRRPFMWMTALAGASTVAWPAIAWLTTGRMTAYLETELAWRRPYYDGEPGHGWGTGWWDSANWWFPENALWILVGIGAVVAVIAVLPSTRKLGRVALAWSFGYLAYLVIVLFPQSSIFRLLAPMWPLAGSIARSRTASLIAIVLGVSGQFFWIEGCWSVQGSDWTPP